jgi:capsular polysaccharide biosynthesis protein
LDIWGAITVLVRRYYFSVPLLALGFVLAYTYTQNIKPEYHASASVLLVGPTAVVSKDVPQPINPYASLGAGTVAAAVELDMTTTETLNEIRAAGNSTQFSVNNFTASTITLFPIISIATTADTPQRAVSTANQIVTIIQAHLAARQKPYVPAANQQITAQVISDARGASTDATSKKKARYVAIGVGLVGSIVLTLLGDAMLKARARRRRVWAVDSEGVMDEPAPQTPTQSRSPVVRS